MTADPLSRTSAVFLLVDHQTGVFERVQQRLGDMRVFF